MRVGVRLSAAVAVGKLAGMVSQRLNLGGGTTVPGLLVRKLDPSSLRLLAERLPQGGVVVTGTNGKTTTTRLISSILAAAGWRVVHNRSGANLVTGVISALARDANLAGRPRADVGLFEVDEAMLPVMLHEMKPRVLLITNLFRDQLDRYGEVDHVAAVWRQSLPVLGSDSTLVLNADDPLVASLGRELDAGPERPRVIYYGIEDASQGHSELDHTADSRNCVQCGVPYSYEVVYYGHVGKYFCSQCGLRRPRPAVYATEVKPDGLKGSSLRLATPAGEMALRIGIPGLYNVYNALAAASAGIALGLETGQIQRGVENFTAAFGRIERVEVEGREVYLILVKNPAGFNQVIRTLFSGPTKGDEGEKRNVFIVINDNFADGTDVSWLWDVDFELMAGKVKFVLTGGTRAEDMANRLKYALVEPSHVTSFGSLSHSLEEAWAQAIQRTPVGETLYVLPTYTAMLELRALLSSLGYVRRFWED